MTFCLSVGSTTLFSIVIEAREARGIMMGTKSFNYSNNMKKSFQVFFFVLGVLVFLLGLLGDSFTRQMIGGIILSIGLYPTLKQKIKDK